MKRWLRGPLVHSQPLGLAIFGAYRLLGPDEQPQCSVVVTEGIINGQVESFLRTRLRPPAPHEAAMSAPGRGGKKWRLTTSGARMTRQRRPEHGRDEARQPPDQRNDPVAP